MKYLNRSFTVPATNTATQKQWDRAFLSEADFEQKYGEKPEATNERD